ncbi:hypothetical protein [Pseudomonas fluorescens]|uniref:hypothetical protein n=1 Tax=Pseudomonas fluorescens TaxID=294 RepID=UPI001259A354|nr:hypothetical protein [Pseudomonas fluorescens]VVN47561.1 hypothetical protein PS676_05897 [Pseudomonas fluorescens]
MIKLKINQRYYDVNQYPDRCPHCRHAIKAEVVLSAINSAEDIIDIVFSCPRYECLRISIAVYVRNTTSLVETLMGYRLRYLHPMNPIDPIFSPHVAKVSPQYVEIFKQASKAEAFDLGEIAGVGYRKALEFLVKDYCITKNPDKEEEIKAKFLGRVIDNHVDNVNIKQCAKRAVWLGNDETHYVRVWVEKDIKDLKLLIQLTVGWIEQEILTEILMKDMQQG